jgi:6-phosphogluconolactonase
VKTIFLPENNWEYALSSMLIADMLNAINKKNSCSFVLTGGQTASRVYKALGAQPKFRKVSNVSFYISDERAVPLNDPESNFDLVTRELFPSGLPPSCVLHPILANEPDLELACNSYESLLPKKLDLALLSAADDGHIASIFPESNEALESGRGVIPTRSPSHPYQRVTITPKIFKECQCVYIMALGPRKKRFQELLYNSGEAALHSPAHAIPNATWIFNL